MYVIVKDLRVRIFNCTWRKQYGIYNAIQFQDGEIYYGLVYSHSDTKTRIHILPLLSGTNKFVEYRGHAQIEIVEGDIFHTTNFERMMILRIDDDQVTVLDEDGDIEKLELKRVIAHVRLI